MMMLAVGAGLAFGSILLSMLIDGNSIGPLIGPSSFVIVFFGSIGAALMSIQTSDVRRVVDSARYAFQGRPADKGEVIGVLSPLADVARREGMLALEGRLEDIDDEFVRAGIQQLVDGADAEQIAEVLQIDIAAMDERHRFGIDFWKAVGGFAPTFGMVGTVIGLVNMLGNLSDPQQLGRGMSVALLTTLYGVLMSNVAFLPVAARLDALNRTELSARDVAVDGVLSIQAGVSSRVLEERLRTYLGPAGRQDASAEVGAGDPTAEAA